MAGRIFADAGTGLALNAHIFNATGQRWNGSSHVPAQDFDYGE